MGFKKSGTDQEFKVSKENLQKLSEDFNVNLEELDNDTRESLLGLYDPSKYTWTHKICDYAGWFFVLVTLITIIRLHWFTLIISLFFALTSFFIGFLIQRSNANKQLKIYKKKLIHRKIAAEALFIDEVWENVLEQLRHKRNLLADILSADGIKPNMISKNVLIISGDEKFKNSTIYKQLNDPHSLDALSEAIEEVTGEVFKIYYV